MAAQLGSTIEPGTTVGGRYRVRSLIGKGGMGAVYAAENLNSGRSAALKVIHGVDQTADQKRRFLREAKAATAIDHPNVIDVFDVFEDDDGSLVMVMELLEGEPMDAHRKARGALTLLEVAELFSPVVAALQVAHDKGIVHRDLKPENIFLARGRDGEVIPKVLDFGIAKVLDPTTINGDTQGGATATGSILGTPHYMSFEQAMSEKDIDHRTDIWSLGVMIFEALTGRRPIEFENLGGMYSKFLTGEVPSIRELIPDMPEDAAAVIDHALCKERAGRLDTLTPLADMLERYLDPAAGGAEIGGRVVSERPPASRASSLSASSTKPRGDEPSRSKTPLVIGFGAVALVVGYLVLARDGGEAVPAAPPDDSVATSAPRAEPTATEEDPRDSDGVVAAPSASTTVSVASAPSPQPAAKPPRPAVPVGPPVVAQPAKPEPEPAAPAQPPPPAPKGLAEEDPYK